MPDDYTLIIRDKRENFKLKFPFYRMNVKAFEYKLDEICTNHEMAYLNNNEVQTQVTTIEAFKESFCKIKDFEKHWDRIEMLL